MKVEKVIELDFEKVDDCLTTYSLPAVQMLVNTTSVAGNFQVYGVKVSEENRIKKYTIPLSVLRDRRDKAKKIITTQTKYLDFIKQIVGD